VAADVQTAQQTECIVRCPAPLGTAQRPSPPIPARRRTERPPSTVSSYSCRGGEVASAGSAADEVEQGSVTGSMSSSGEQSGSWPSSRRSSSDSTTTGSCAFGLSASPCAPTYSRRGSLRGTDLLPVAMPGLVGSHTIPRRKVAELFDVHQASDASLRGPFSAMLGMYYPSVPKREIDRLARELEDQHEEKQDQQTLLSARASSRARHWNQSRSERLVKLFGSWDADGSGTISIQEFVKALSGLPMNAAEVEAMFTAHDADQSGTLDLAEFVALMEESELFQHFDHICENQSKSLRDEQRRPLDINDIFHKIKGCSRGERPSLAAVMAQDAMKESLYGTDFARWRVATDGSPRWSRPVF